DGRAAGPYHRRRRGRELPADERQLRAVSAAGRREEEAAQGSLHRAGQGRLRRMAREKHGGPRLTGGHLETGQQLQRVVLAGRGAVGANSAALSSRSPLASALSNLSAVATAHSSKVSRLLPSTSSLRKASVREDSISSRVIRRSRLRS